jgi:hypothetical protein
VASSIRPWRNPTGIENFLRAWFRGDDAKCRTADSRIQISNSHGHIAGASEAIHAATPPSVIPCESGVSSTPRPLDSIADASEYWITRFRG